jgi:hypothetical protein
MRRQTAIPPLSTALGLAFALLGPLAGACSADGFGLFHPGWWCHPYGYSRTTTVTRGYPGYAAPAGYPAVMGSPAATGGTAAPTPSNALPPPPPTGGTGSATPTGATPNPYAPYAPYYGYNPYTPYAPSTGSTYPYGYSGYSYAPYSPGATTTGYGYYPASSGLPLSPYTHLTGYDPDAPSSATTPLAPGPVLVAARILGDRILGKVRDAARAAGNQVDEGGLLQTAIDIFGRETGLSPLSSANDMVALAKIAGRVFREVRSGPAASTPPPPPPPGALPVPPAGVATTPPGAPAAAASTRTIEVPLTITIRVDPKIEVVPKAKDDGNGS